jgi:release factor glutamine methyltransferase
MGQRGEIKERMKDLLDKTLLELVKSGEEVLEASGAVEDPRLESEVLLSALIKGRRLDLYLRKDEPVDPALAGEFRQMLLRRSDHEPVQYITGKEIFLKRSFSVGPGVLIPRPETEGLVLTALSCLKEGPFLDLGTGSGCIPISILLEHQECKEGYAVDLSPEALSFARANARSFGVASRLHFFEGDLFQPLPEKAQGSFEVIVSNPPYLDMEKDDIDLSVRKFEPEQALNGGPGGLSFYKRIFNETAPWLKPGGFLILEIGMNQWPPLRSLLEELPCWQVIDLRRDEQGIDRILSLRYKG